MAVTIRIPTQLRELSGGASEVSIEGATVKPFDTADLAFLETRTVVLPAGWLAFKGLFGTHRKPGRVAGSRSPALRSASR